MPSRPPAEFCSRPYHRAPVHGARHWRVRQNSSQLLLITAVGIRQVIRVTGNTDAGSGVIGRIGAIAAECRIRFQRGWTRKHQRAVGTVDNLDPQPVIGGINLADAASSSFGRGSLRIACSRILFRFLKTTRLVRPALPCMLSGSGRCHRL